jgi:hypothetical protein
MIALIAASSLGAGAPNAVAAEISHPLNTNLSSDVASFTPPTHLLRASTLAVPNAVATEDHDHDSGGDHDHVHTAAKQAQKGVEASFQA